MEELSFSTEYNAENHHHIMFDWNGKYSTEFLDSNQGFRRNIIKFIIENEQIYFPLDLIRDLFLEEAKWSVEAWSVGFNFHKLGEKLIKYGQNKYLDDFLVGAFSSFDTYCASRMMNLGQYEIDLVLEELKIRNKDSEINGLMDKYESGIELFKSYKEGNQRGGLYQLTGEAQVKNIRIVKPNKIKNLLRDLYKKIRRNL